MSRLFAFLTAGVVGLLLASAPAPAQGRPNVVVLVADDLGYGDLGSYGSPDALTPHLDALAARGLRFTDFYAGGPICTPSRYALLTGRHPFRGGDPALLDALRPRDTASGIGAGELTLAEALGGVGYKTAIVGKWHLGHGEFVASGGAGDTEFHPLHHGFDSFFGPLRGTVDYNTHWWREDVLDWWEDRRPVPEDTLRYATQVFGDRAVSFIEGHAGAGTTEPPFFLYLPFLNPHLGATQDQSLLARTQLPVGEDVEREYLSRFDHLTLDDTDIRKRYLAMVAVLDDEVGRIVDALERTGLMENTIVWVLSDNGPREDVGSAGEFRSFKGTPYEGGIRVPSFVVWPPYIAPRVSGQLAATVDVLPTVLSLARVPSVPEVDGLDLSYHLVADSTITRGVAVPNTEIGDAYREGRWKLVRRYRSDGQPRPDELYDLDADPGETTDLAAVYPDTVAVLWAQMPYDATGAPNPGQHHPYTAGLEASVALRVLPNPAGAGGAVEVVLGEEAAVRVEAFD
ncbi:MAG: sulfatase-like hydrolase/transferase, partial [Rubricoccaceae bacterium]|nr:sulfatase-like hydrolase/transferase [Rubricoccaceae bacterium]